MTESGTGTGPERGAFELPATRFDFAARVPPISEIVAAHFIAIGGSGMSGIAQLYLDAGITVSGSDQRESATLTALRATGATIRIGHHADHLPDPAAGRTVVIVSSAVREDNPELRAARDRGLTVLHRAQGLAALLPGRTSLAVAGANGKTTTSAMLTVALAGAGAEPGYVIGAPIHRTGTSASLGAGPAFVVEADESDGSFLSYRPEVAVVTNIRPDHLDHYRTFEAIQEAFRAFSATIRPGGLLVVCQDDPGAAALGNWYAEQGGRVLRYGVAGDADLRVSQVETTADGTTTRARLTGLGNSADQLLSIPFPGLHNLSNAAGAVAAAVGGLGVDIGPVLTALASFSGTARRFEAVGDAAGVRIVDDYAHNPDKVAAVVAAGQSVIDATGGRLVVVFQPHLFSRTRDFTEAFAQALSGADLVIVLDIFAAREDPVPGVSGENVADAVAALRPRDRQDEVRFLAGRADAAVRIAPLLTRGDLVLTVGAGDITTLGAELLSELGRGEDAAAGSGEPGQA